MYEELIKHLIFLHKKAIEYESKDINGNTIPLRKRFLKDLLFVSFSIITIINIPKGFSDEFIDYVKDILAIFVGLFLTALIFAYEKLGNIIVEDDNIKMSSQDRVRNIQEYNYSKKFLYALGYNVILCTITLLLLFINILFSNVISIDVSNYKISIIPFKLVNLINFVWISIVLIQRTIVVYNIINIFYYTLYTVSSLINVLNIKKQKNDRN